MIRYHGGPVTPLDAAIELWTERHALVSFAYPQQDEMAFRRAISVILDNGAFSAWEQGLVIDWEEYAAWVRKFWKHPSFDWALIPDVIDGDEKANDDLIAWWDKLDIACVGVPVWHLHESLDRLQRLVTNFDRIALGSSGEFSDPGSSRWWSRMSEAMPLCCDGDGWPHVKMHGLRQMDPVIFSHIPYASVDSAKIPRSIGVERSVPKGYRGHTPKQRALEMAWDCDKHRSAARWLGSSGVQAHMEFV